MAHARQHHTTIPLHHRNNTIINSSTDYDTAPWCAAIWTGKLHCIVTNICALHNGSDEAMHTHLMRASDEGMQPHWSCATTRLACKPLTCKTAVLVASVIACSSKPHTRVLHTIGAYNAAASRGAAAALTLWLQRKVKARSVHKQENIAALHQKMSQHCAAASGSASLCSCCCVAKCIAA